MKKNLITAITFCISLLLHFAVEGQIKKTDIDKSLLWRVTSKDMKEPSYLFGTIHLICPEDYIWTNTMKKCLTDSKELCLEMDMDDPNIVMQIAMGMMDNSGKTLKDYFKPADYNKLEKYIKDSVGMNIELFQQMKPAALLSIFTSKSAQCTNAISYENNIMEEAKKTNKEVTGLETVGEQLDLFDNLPVDSVIKEIVSSLNGTDNDNEYNKLITAYKNQDLPALHQFIKESGAADKDLDGFLDVRNEKWIPRIIEKMDNQSVFFAVGAGHLYGEKGLIILLRKAGYTVTPVF